MAAHFWIGGGKVGNSPGTLNDHKPFFAPTGSRGRNGPPKTVPGIFNVVRLNWLPEVREFSYHVGNQLYGRFHRIVHRTT
jgi:hypothetical protein